MAVAGGGTPKPIRDALANLKPLALELDGRWRQDSIRWQGAAGQLLGELHRLRHMSVDAYHFDSTYAAGPFPGLNAMTGISRDNADPATWLSAETQFFRQRDRLIDGLHQLTVELAQKLR